MGFFSKLFRAASRPATHVDHGLSYRAVYPFTVEVLIEAKWVEACGQAEDQGKPTRDSLSTIRQYNATAACKTESEAFAVGSVLDAMDHFCEHCGHDATHPDKKCDNCGKKLWNGKRKLEMVIVHVE
jgi:hypothetical protein